MYGFVVAQPKISARCLMI